MTSPATEISPTAFVALDEAFEPYISVAGIVVESPAVQLNQQIRDLHNELSSEYQLDGLKSFELFKRSGFHATSDTFEISTKFISFLSRTLDFTSYVFTSSRRRRPDLGPKATVLVLYRELVRTVLRKYGPNWTVEFIFEQHEELAPYFKDLVQSAKTGIKRAPKTRVSTGKKQDPPLLAVADYVLWIVNKWLQLRATDGSDMSSANRLVRCFRAISPSLSVIRSLEHGTITRRVISYDPASASHEAGSLDSG